LLDVSRITSGRLAIRREPVPMAQVLTQVVDAIQQSVYQHTLELELAPGTEDAWVAGDEVRLVQVFNNLLVNAIKFTPAGGTIRVTARVQDDSVRVDVQDSGVGVTQPELKHIFELFYQAPQSSDRARGGLGLGLAIVKSLVEMHGGGVSAASDGPGHGTCVSVVLPLCEVPAASVLPEETESARGAAKILVVDDNEDAADTCATLLEIHGYELRVAYTPDGALQTLDGFTPDVAILDIGLPGMSGYTLAGRMQAPPFNYRGRLIALTGYGQAADMAASKAAGFDAHLTKPVSPGELLDLVAQFAQQAAGSFSSSDDNPS
jgi:CheY-like chemotaxis protein